MPPGVEHQRRPLNAAYAGLDFIKAAFCPLEFSASPLSAHPDFQNLGADHALGNLEVSSTLHYPRQFSYSDAQGHRKTGTQLITAHFGLAPTDVDLFLGLYTYLRRLPELPPDGCTHVTIDFLARQLKLPATCQKDYVRLRSRLFRLSYTKYTSSAFWNGQARSYDIVNFGLFGLESMARMTESRRPIVLQWDPTFLRLVGQGASLAFDYDLYRSLSPALRRFYLIANRDGWNQPHSSLYVADDFTIHQIGYSDSQAFTRQRRQKLKRLLADAECLDLIRPFADWNGYLQPIADGPRRGSLALRWTRGPALRAKPVPRAVDPADPEDDPLYAQLRELRDELGQPFSWKLYCQLAARFSPQQLQRQVSVVLAQKEHRPGSFQKSEVAAFVDRVQHDRPDPDWYGDLRRTERLSKIGEVTPNQLSLDLYKTLFHN